LQIKTKIVSHHTADSKPVKQEVNGTVILPPLVFPGLSIPGRSSYHSRRRRRRRRRRIKMNKVDFEILQKNGFFASTFE
jgi:hypothetical protein